LSLPIYVLAAVEGSICPQYSSKEDASVGGMYQTALPTNWRHLVVDTSYNRCNCSYA